MEVCFPFHCQRNSATAIDCRLPYCTEALDFIGIAPGKYFRRNFSPKFYGVWRLADRADPADLADPVNPYQIDPNCPKRLFECV